jgi:hypothetical protein
MRPSCTVSDAVRYLGQLAGGDVGIDEWATLDEPHHR